jgi:hypothetical protein
MSTWDRMPWLIKVLVAVLAVVYFGGALIAPLFWKV